MVPGETAALWALLDECRDFVRGCVGSSYHDTGNEDEEFLDRLDAVLATKKDKAA